MDNIDEKDVNKDGIVTPCEQDIYQRKAVNRRRMAWLSLVALIVSGVFIMFFVPEGRLDKLDGLLEIYFVALGSIVGAYVGISTWMTKK
jgi:glucose uptake protein GlcU